MAGGSPAGNRDGLDAAHAKHPLSHRGFELAFRRKVIPPVLHAATNHLVDAVLALILMVGGVIGGVMGAWLGGWIPASWQQALFGALLLIVSLWSRRARLHEAPQPAIACHCSTALFIGGGLGLLTGLLGVGGGFLMVPALIVLGISHFPTAVAHSLILIAINATASGLTYLGTIPTDIRMLLVVGLLAAVGSFFGSHLLKTLPRKPLQTGFSLGLAALGLIMLMQLLFA